MLNVIDSCGGGFNTTSGNSYFEMGGEKHHMASTYTCRAIIDISVDFRYGQDPLKQHTRVLCLFVYFIWKIMSKKEGPESFLKQKCDTIFVKPAHSSVGKGTIRVHPSFTPDEHCVIRGKTLVCDFFFLQLGPFHPFYFPVTDH